MDPTHLFELTAISAKDDGDESQAGGTLYVCPITAWELALASRKPAHGDPPNLGAKTPSNWFSQVVAITACEAAAVAVETGHKDPGDCFLIATARLRRISIVIRDALIRRLAASDHIDMIVC